MGYPDRIKKLRDIFSMNQTEFSNFLGVSRTALSEFENGAREPSRDFFIALSNKGVSTDWFISGVGEPLTNRLNNELFAGKNHPTKSQDISLPNTETGLTIDDSSMGVNDREAKEETMTNVIEAKDQKMKDGLTLWNDIAKRDIPVIVEGHESGLLIPVVNQGLSAGLGFDYDEGEIIRYIQIPAWVSRKSRDLVALPIYGDSMEPTIGRGDLAVCDSGGFKDDGIYALRDEERGLMFCKRVVWEPGGWEIMSDNPRYNTKRIAEGAIRIIGRVVAAVKEVK